MTLMLRRVLVCQDLESYVMLQDEVDIDATSIMNFDP